MTARWQDWAACKPYPLDWWFLVRHGGRDGNASIYDRARIICRSCPVRNACLDYALEEEYGQKKDNRHGMFGGLIPRERYSVDRERRMRGAA